MSRITYDMSEVAAGAGLPTGWTQSGSSSNVAYEIVADLGSPGLQSLEIQKSGAGRNRISLDTADGDNQQGVILVSSDSNSSAFSLWINAGGSDGNEDGYLMELDFNSNNIGLWEFTSGTPVNHDNDSFTLNSGTEYWMRLCRFSTGDIRGRIWEAGDQEPTTWNVSVNDSTHTTGQCMISEFGNGTFTTTVEWYSVGWGSTYDSACTIHIADFPDDAVYYSCSDDDSVRFVELDGGQKVLVHVYGPSKGLQQVKWHIDKQLLYTTLFSVGDIRRLDRFGMNEEVLETGIVGDVFGITFDYANSLMYYTAREASSELWKNSDDGGSGSIIVSGIAWAGHPDFNPDDGFIYVPYDFAVRSYDSSGTLQVTMPTDTSDIAHFAAVDDDNVNCGYWNDANAMYLPKGTTVGPWTNGDATYNLWHAEVSPDRSVMYAAAYGNDLIRKFDGMPQPAATVSTLASGVAFNTVHSVTLVEWKDPANEIVDDYLNQSDVKRTKVIAKLAELSGSGTKADRYWVIDETVLPAGMMDSDLSTAPAPGAATLRMSTSYTGLTRLALEVLDFTPASGGVGGGATAEIYVRPNDPDHDVEFPVWLWWGRAGKTAAAVDSDYGQHAVRGLLDCAGSWTAEDYSDSSPNGNDGTATSITLNTDIPYGKLRSFESDTGSNDRISVADHASLDLTELTIYGMFKCETDTTTFQGLISKRLSFTVSNFSLAFDTGGNMDWNYIDAVGFKGVSVVFLTDFSIGNWEFIAASLKQNGADVDVKLYNDTGLIASTTILSSTILTNSHPLLLNNLEQSSFGFPLDGMMKGWNVINSELDADVIQTIANNVTSVVDFWEFGFATEEGPFDGSDPSSILVPTQGSLDSQYSPIFSSIICGEFRDWTFVVNKFLPGGDTAPSNVSIVLHEDIVLEYGPASIRQYVISIPSKLRLDFRDPDLALYNEMKAARMAGLTDYWYYGQLASNDGVYQWRGWVKVGLTRKFIGDKAINTTQLELYDGVGKMDSFPTYVPHKAQNNLHMVMRDMLAYSVQPLGIDYINDFVPTNIEAALATMTRIHLDIQAAQGRVRTSFVDYSQRNRQEAVESLLEAMMMTVWQGLDGVWHCKQVGKMGRNYQVEQYPYAAVDIADVTSFDFGEVTVIPNNETILVKTVADGDFDDVATIEMSDEVTNLVVTTTLDDEEDHDGQTTSFQMNRNPIMRDWYLSGPNTGILKFYRQTSITGTITRDNRATIESAQLDTGGTGLVSFKYDLGWWTLNEEQYFNFEMEWGAERNGGAGTVSMEFRLVVRPYDGAPDSVSAFITSGGTWGFATPGWISTVGITPDPNGTNPITWVAALLRTVERIPMTGRVEFEIRHTALLDYLHVNEIYIYNVDKAGNFRSTIKQVSTYKSHLDKAGGEDLKIEHKSIPHGSIPVSGADMLMTISTYGLNKMFSSTEFLTLHPIEYIDHIFNELNVESISLSHAKANETALAPFIGYETLEADVKDIISPERMISFDNKIFVPQKCAIKIIPEITHVIAPERPGGGSGDQYKTFLIDDDNDYFYRVSADGTFPLEEWTGLDLSVAIPGDSIIDIDYDAAFNIIWGLGVNGGVYNWKPDGTSVSGVIFSVSTDNSRIKFDNKNRRLGFSAEELATSNWRWKEYTLAGALLSDWQARMGTGSWGSHPSIGYGYFSGLQHLYWASTGGGVSRMRMFDGITEGIQGLSALQRRSGCVIEEDDHVYMQGGSAMYRTTASAINQVGFMLLVGGGLSLSNASKQDWFEDVNGSKHIVLSAGGLAGPGTYQVYSVDSGTTDQTAGSFNVRTHCCKHSYNS
ncbi:MAG: hypothetical protein GY938_12975 [Ketobacter sp.]|nr:hypothetical protein [Ketobacter sp.]